MSSMLLQMFEAAWVGGPGPWQQAMGPVLSNMCLVLLQMLEGGRTGHTLSKEADKAYKSGRCCRRMRAAWAVNLAMRPTGGMPSVH